LGKDVRLYIKTGSTVNIERLYDSCRRRTQGNIQNRRIEE
jgi:hypothetical protein